MQIALKRSLAGFWKKFQNLSRLAIGFHKNIWGERECLHVYVTTYALTVFMSIVSLVDFIYKMHASRSGHTNFAESTEEIKPLTDEEKAEQKKR